MFEGVDIDTTELARVRKWARRGPVIYVPSHKSHIDYLMLPKVLFEHHMHIPRFAAGKNLAFWPMGYLFRKCGAFFIRRSFAGEIGGGTKKQEDFRQLMKTRHFLKARYGKVYIRFDHPFSLRDYLSRTEEGEKDADMKLAFHLIRSINAVSLVTPLSLVATAILANHRKGFLLSELLDTTDTLMDFLREYGIPKADTLADPPRAVQETLSLLIRWKILNLLEDTDQEEEVFYYVDEEKKLDLEYYKNSIIHFFIPHAFVAVSLLTEAAEVKTQPSILSDYVFLKDLFKGEFVFDENEVLEEKVAPIIAYFLDSAFLSPFEQSEGYRITKLGFDKLPIWAALAKTFLESYWIAAKCMGQQRIKSGKKGGDILKNMDYLGRRFHKSGLIDHIGALSRLNYKNALTFMNENILKAQDNTEENSAQTLARLSQLGQRLYELSHYRS
jgi:glycerol-3-phosphate O-acyltransferase